MSVLLFQANWAIQGKKYDFFRDENSKTTRWMFTKLKNVDKYRYHMSLISFSEKCSRKNKMVVILNFHIHLLISVKT